MIKKAFKLIALIAAIAMLAAAFCSCDAIDELRLKHAVWEIEKMDTINFRGKEYSKAGFSYNLNIAGYKYELINITDESVPLLFSSSEGVRGKFNEQHEIISYNSNIYATKENIDYIKSVIADQYNAINSYGVYNYKKLWDGSIKAELQLVPDEIKSVLDDYDRKLDTQKDMMYTSGDIVGRFTSCDEKGMLGNGDEYQIKKLNNYSYYICGDKDYMKMDAKDVTTILNYLKTVNTKESDVK